MYWYRKSAEQGLARAQNELALMYYDGKGVTVDDIEAYKWLNIALIGGYEIEKYRISSLEKRMTASQIESAQKLVREWEEKHQ